MDDATEQAKEEHLNFNSSNQLVLVMYENQSIMTSAINGLTTEMNSFTSTPNLRSTSPPPIYIVNQTHINQSFYTQKKGGFS